MQNQSADKSSPQQLLVWSLCALTIGLLAWRCATVFNGPPDIASSHPISALIDAIVGPGNAQISETANGGLLILLNGPTDAIDPEMAARLTDIVQPLSPTGVAPVLKQLPFAQSAGFAPTNAEMAEISVLGILAGLAICFAFVSRSGAQASGSADHAPIHPLLPQADMSALSEFFDDAPEAPPFDMGPQPASVVLVPAEAGPRSLVDARRFANANPDVTAKVIENWIRARGFDG